MPLAGCGVFANCQAFASAPEPVPNFECLDTHALWGWHLEQGKRLESSPITTICSNLLVGFNLLYYTLYNPFWFVCCTSDAPREARKGRPEGEASEARLMRQEASEASVWIWSISDPEEATALSASATAARWEWWGSAFLLASICKVLGRWIQLSFGTIRCSGQKDISYLS